jgi:predicted neuraminidase
VWHHILSLGAIALTGLSAVAAARAPAWPDAFVPAPAPPVCTGEQTFQTEVMRSAAPNFAHVASAVALSDGRLRAFWYEGSRELAPDVVIMTATYANGVWSPARAIIGARQTARAVGRYVRKLGNAVVYRDSRGNLVLLFASMSIGGWSAASLNIMRSTNEGETWSAPRRLVTSPVFDFGTLVRSPPVPMSGSAVMVPAYDELANPYPEVIVLADDGRVVGRRRIGDRRASLQPQIVPFDDRAARVFTRARRTGYALAGETADAGWSWSSLVSMALPSLDNPVAALRLDGDTALIAYNARGLSDSVAGPLMLARSADRGRTWRDVHAMHHERGTARYPWLMAGPNGLYHLFYTHAAPPGSAIVHVRFSRDWLAARGGPPCP